MVAPEIISRGGKRRACECKVVLSLLCLREETVILRDRRLKPREREREL